MRTFILPLCVIAVVLAGSGRAGAQNANPLSRGANFNYRIIKSFVSRAADKMPQDHYSFRPTPDVRTFAALVGHLADANYRLCSVAAGEQRPPLEGIEKSQTTKADLAQALAASFEYCDKVFGAMTDSAGTTIVKFSAGGEGARVPIELPKLSVLAFHTQHAFEHYGNIVTYMRLKGLVPPSSEPRRGQ
jgi:uncharacterized damage-inducible protein DinB